MIGLVACVVALRDRRLRPLAAMALASVAVYAMVFRQAAAGHQYWNYWALLPAAVGWAYALRTCWPGCAAPTARRGCRSGRCVVLVVLVGAFNLLRPDQARDEISRGERAADLVATTRFPASQHELAYVGEPYRADAWVVYATRFFPRPLTSAAQLDQLARSHPDDLVLVLGACPIRRGVVPLLPGRHRPRGPVERGRGGGAARAGPPGDGPRPGRGGGPSQSAEINPTWPGRSLLTMNGAGLVSGDISAPRPTSPWRGDQAVPTGHIGALLDRRSTHIMLRLQAPLPERYTDAPLPELDAIGSPTPRPSSASGSSSSATTTSATR